MRSGMALPRVEYTEQEIATWRIVYNELKRLYATNACKQHNYVLPLLEQASNFFFYTELTDPELWVWPRQHPSAGRCVQILARLVCDIFLSEFHRVYWLETSTCQGIAEPSRFFEWPCFQSVPLHSVHQTPL